MKTHITPAEAREIIFSQIKPMSQVTIPLSDALGRILQQRLTAKDDVPPFDNSAMDGYALCEADLEESPVTLEVTGEIAAGANPALRIEKGTCIRIMTGAPVPKDAAAIVPVEWTRSEGPSSVAVERLPASGQFIRSAGRDLKRGEGILEIGTKLTPTSIGLIAVAGYGSVSVAAVPRVTLVVTGNELCRDDGPLPPGKIRDANGPALVAQIQDAGGMVVAVQHARDKKAQVAAALRRGLEASDVILFSGGVSVGDYDHVNDVLDAAGVERHFWRVRQRPGGPMSFGTREGQLVFGLPGNPVSSFVCFEQYVRPALHGLMSGKRKAPELHRAVLETAVSKAPGLHHFVRGFACRNEQGQLRVETTGPQASNLYTSAAAANCLIHLPEEMADAELGQQVMIEKLPWVPAY